MSSNLKPLHRTITLDYGILISGSLTLILENNERTVLRPGDIVVQRGTLHAWENEGTGELAALRRACASRKAATEIRCEESDVKLPSRGRGRTGGRMETESLGDSGRT